MGVLEDLWVEYAQTCIGEDETPFEVALQKIVYYGAVMSVIEKVRSCRTPDEAALAMMEVETECCEFMRLAERAKAAKSPLMVLVNRNGQKSEEA